MLQNVVWMWQALRTTNLKYICIFWQDIMMDWSHGMWLVRVIAFSDLTPVLFWQYTPCRHRFHAVGKFCENHLKACGLNATIGHAYRLHLGLTQLFGWEEWYPAWQNLYQVSQRFSFITSEGSLVNLGSSGRWLVTWCVCALMVCSRCGRGFCACNISFEYACSYDIYVISQSSLDHSCVICSMTWYVKNKIWTFCVQDYNKWILTILNMYVLVQHP